jgi:galactan 5-O-arabinofuranosyltransferase
MWSRSAWSVTVELILAVAVGAAVSLALQWAAERPHIPMPSNVPTALLTLTTTPVMAALIAIAVRRWKRWRTWATWAAWAGLSALATLTLALFLQGTRYYIGGISVDQVFRTQYLTRLASSPALADMNYRDIPPFYPAGWFWIGGRFANLIGLPGWAAFKPFAITSVAVTATLVFTIWSLIVSRRTAVLLALVTTLIGLHGGVDEPYTWLLAATLPPVAAIAMRALGTGVAQGDGQRTHRHRSALVGVGIFVGVSGAVYTLYFGFAVLVLVTAAAVVAVTTHMTARRQGAGLRWTAIARTLVLRLIAIGLVGLPIMLLVWAPYLLWALRRGLPAGAAQHYLPLDGAVFPLPMLDVSIQGALCLAGTIWLILAAHRSEIARGLLVVSLVVYGWYVLSTLALAAGTTLLAFRLQTVLSTTLICAGVLGLIEARRWLRTTPWLQSQLQGRRRSAAVAAVMGLAAAVSLVQTSAEASPTTGSNNHAYSDYYPTGVKALGKSNPADDGAWNGALIKTIGTLSGKAPRDTALLSTNYELCSFEPYWCFQQITAHYANPIANFDARNAEIANWAQAANAADLISRLDHSRFAAPGVFILRRAADGLHITVSRDVFPRDPNVEAHDVVFPEHLFASPLFAQVDVGPFVVVARR